MAKTSRKTSAYDKFRREELAKIHIGKSQLGLADDIYRDIVREASGGKCESSADLDWRGRRAVLERFAELGWKIRHKGKGQAKPSRPQADYPEAKMIRGLWLELHQLYEAGAVKAVRDPSEKALNNFVKRMTRVDDMHWLATSGRIADVIEALKAWVKRSRVECFTAWVVTYDASLPEVMLAALVAAACKLGTGAKPDECQRARLGEAGWHIYVAYAGYLQTRER